MSTFERGTTIRFRLTVKDFDGNIPTTPLTETPTCLIFNPDSPQSAIGNLQVESYETNKFQAYWTIPLSVPVGTVSSKGKDMESPTLSKMYYAEWGWKWNGKNFVERVSFNIIHVE